MEKTTLFYLENSNIKISLMIYFNEDNHLFFDGYDIGKNVEQAFGDSDYEYTYTIEEKEVERFYQLFHITLHDRPALLLEIQKRFSCNEAYSLFGDFMEKNNIKYKSFTY